MALTRRHFIKGLALISGAIGLGPLAKFGEAKPETITFNTVLPMRPDGISGDSAFEDDEERLIFHETRIIIDQRRKSPLFAGKIGRYEGVTIFRHK